MQKQLKKKYSIPNLNILFKIINYKYLNPNALEKNILRQNIFKLIFNYKSSIKNKLFEFLT